MKILRYILLLAAATLIACTTDTVDEETNDPKRTTTGTPSAVVEWMDDKLSYYYLYNDEYNTMNLDYGLEYDSFLSYHLLKMDTNVLDRKYNSSTESYEIYSYIDQYSSSMSMSRSLYSTEDGFGFVNLVALVSGNSYYLGILGVYPDSPADEKGITRGYVISSVNGTTINKNNYNSYATMLLNPSAGTTYSLGFYGSSAKISVTSDTIAPNPVIHSEIIDGDIGYLVYSQFNSNFDTQLLSALGGMANVKNFILDLRLNGGGYNSSAVILASAIRGNTSEKQIFAEYVYNDNLSGKYTQYDYFSSIYARLMNLTSKKIYCLVSGSTASASELVINALEGIGFDVILIGDTTEGKNVGMFVHDDTIEGYYYVFAPITFISKNAAGFYEYQNGFAPDCYVNEYLGFSNYGESEPLVAAAINHINNGSFEAVSMSRSAEIFTKEEIIERKYPRGVLRRAE